MTKRIGKAIAIAAILAAAAAAQEASDTATAAAQQAVDNARSVMEQYRAKALEDQDRAQTLIAEQQAEMAAQEKEIQAQLQPRLAELQAQLQEKMSTFQNTTAAAKAMAAEADSIHDLLAQASPPVPARMTGGRTIYAPSAPYGISTAPYGASTAARADAVYSRGQNALDQRRWDEALADFSQVVTQGGDRVEGALYWKAYALNKLGRRDEALAAIADLRKSYPSSRWLQDAGALEIEVKQSSGQPVSPQAQSDEDLKLMALNGLMQTDPDKALTAVDGILKSTQSPRLKEQALFVLAQNNSPKAQQMLEQVARGSGNPDLQAKAVSFLGATPRAFGPRGSSASQNQPNRGPLLMEIYGSSNDANVKRAVIDALAGNRDSDHLLQIAKTEKSSELRADAIRRLTGLRNPSDADSLVSLYSSEQDTGVKREIISSLAGQNSVKQMVAAARTEKDPEMVRYIVSRLSSMKSPEASDYLMEILKK